MLRCLIVSLLSCPWLLAQTVDVSHHWTYNDLGFVDTLEWLPAFNERVYLELSYESETESPTEVAYSSYSNGETTASFNLFENIKFNPLGDLLEMQSHDGNSYQTNYDYDDLGRTNQHTHKIDGRNEYRASQFQYDDWGNISRYYKQLATSGWLDFTYTDQNMLRSFSYGNQGGVTYEYDKFGNMTYANGFQGSVLTLEERPQKAYDQNQNEHTDYQYDDAGRLTSDDRYFYDYRGDGRLGAVRDRKTGWVIASFKYDASGNRVAKIQGEEVTYFSRDEQGKIIFEKIYQEGEQKAFKEFQGHPGGQLVRTKNLETGEEEVNRYFIDYQGTTVMRTFAGGAAAKYEFSPYGLQMQEGEAHDGAYGYTGHETDSETEQTYMRARYFQAESARFTKPDPAYDIQSDRPATLNLYQYTYNNPVNAIDPTGLYVYEEPEYKGSERKKAKMKKEFERRKKAFEAALAANIKRGGDAAKTAEAFGKAGEKNGIVVRFDTNATAGAAANVDHAMDARNGGIEYFAVVTIDPSLSGSDLEANAAHEGQHLVDAIAFYKAGEAEYNWETFDPLTHRQTEVKAYWITHEILKSSNNSNYKFKAKGGTVSLGAGADGSQLPDAEVKQLIDRILEGPLYKDKLDDPIFPNFAPKKDN